jgi:hypothetical protein
MATDPASRPKTAPSINGTLTSVPGSRDAPRRETNSRFRPLKSLPRKPMKIWSMCHCSTAISPPGNQSATRTTAVLVMLSIVSLTPSIAASAVPPCSIATVGVFSKFGALGGKFYQELIWLQALSHSDPRNMHSGSFAGRRKGPRQPPRRGVMF